MKRRLMAVVLIALFVVSTMSGCGKEGKLTKVTLSEVAHSVFYAPQYVAIELGYFEEEGIDIDLVTGFGADKCMTAVLSGDADIGFMGTESSIYVYKEGAKDYVVNFAGLTQRAGNFLVAREANDDFSWDDIKGKTVIGGRAGGMPEMVFEYILKKNGIDPKTDLNIIQNIDFGVTAEAFSTGDQDYTIEFEPAATALEMEGKGHVVASLGVESGMVPYTAYCAKETFIKDNEDLIQKFTIAIQKGLDYVNTHSPEEIAKVIKPQFKETEDEKLVAIVQRYYDQNTWKRNTVFEEDSFDLLQDILLDAGVITEKVPYADLIVTKYSEEAIK